MYKAEGFQQFVQRSFEEHVYPVTCFKLHCSSQCRQAAEKCAITEKRSKTECSSVTKDCVCQRLASATAFPPQGEIVRVIH